MLHYVARRLLLMIPTLFVISALVYVIIDMPPGDCVTSQIDELLSRGDPDALRRADELRHLYGLDQSLVARYFDWVLGVFRWDFGLSCQDTVPVKDLIGERLALTMLMESSTIAFIWIVSFIIGVYAATHQYQVGDYVASFIGFIGLAVPNFLLAIVLLYVGKVYFGLSIGGLMDPDFIGKPMSWDKFVSIGQHLIIPVIVIGTSGTAGMIRRLRANLLDELQKQYVTTARAKGLPTSRLLVKYPLRMSLNFFISDIGSILPAIISGAEITAIVLSLETTGPMLIKALQSQDMYLAGSFLMFLAFLTVIGVLISDIALAFLDPRIRLQGGSTK